MMQASKAIFCRYNLNIVPVALWICIQIMEHHSETTSSLLDGNSHWKYYYKGDMPSNSWSKNLTMTLLGKRTRQMGYGKDNSLYNTILDYGDDSSNKYITATSVLHLR
jgi:hypothetical protein